MRTFRNGDLVGIYQATNNVCNTSADSVIPTKAASNIWSSKIQINSKLEVRSSQYQELQRCSVEWVKGSPKTDELATYSHMP